MRTRLHLRRTLPGLAAAMLALASAGAGAQADAPVHILVPPSEPMPARPERSQAAIVTLSQAFEAALAYDAQYRGARFERDSTQANVPITRAALLPSLTLSASETSSTGQRSFPNAVGQQVTVELDYRAPQQQLQLRTPLFNYEALQRFRQAQRQSEAADAIFRVRAAELIDRLGAAYLQRLLADENLTLISAQLRVLEGQMQRAEQRLQRGEGTRIEVADVASQLEVARARLLDVRDQVQVARRSLLRITGIDAAQVAQVPAGFAPPPLFPAGLDEWIELALSRSAILQARAQQVEVARAGVERSKAGHLPRVDAVASLARSSNDSVSNLGQGNKLASVGVQLSLPLFSGFGVEASVMQSRSELSRAQAELANEREGVRLEVERSYLAVQTGRARIDALTLSLRALELSLEGQQRGLAAGVRTVADVLDAQSRVFSAQRDLVQARLDYLLARTRLQLQSGATGAEVVADIDGLLRPRS